MATPHFHWFNPVRRDAAAFGGGRSPDLDYRRDVARAAERNGFESILCMVGKDVDDPWIAASSLISATKRIKFIVAVRPGYTHPAVIAHHAASFQNVSNDRLWLNIVTASHEAELRGYGDFLDKAHRYKRTAEFFEVLKSAWSGQSFSYSGEHYRVENGGLSAPLAAMPKLFIGGSSAEGQRIGAKYADVHLSYGEPPPLLRQHVERVRELAEKENRTVQFGIRIQVITRPTSEAAWAEADRFLASLDPLQVERQKKAIEERASVGQARVQSFRGRQDDPDSLKIYPNIWAGTGLVSGGGGSTALVGSYEEVAERIDEYLSIGVEHFIISGRPLLESAYEVGEGVLSLFRDRVVEQASNREAAA